MRLNSILPIAVCAISTAIAAPYHNTLVQVQVTSLGVEAPWIVPVAQSGSQLSELPVGDGGARFELWTLSNVTKQEWLLDQKYVTAYAPYSEIAITTEDPYENVARTRADRPFTVNVYIEGISYDFLAPLAARMVQLEHRVQSYGEDGDGLNIDRELSTLAEETYINKNGDTSLQFRKSTIPNYISTPDHTKVRGEETFSVWTLADYQVAKSVTSTQRVQIWPVSSGSISGVEDGDVIRFETPPITFRVDDAYPDSTVYAQVYKGSPVLGTAGKIIASRSYYEVVPQDEEFLVKDWDKYVTESGPWTVEWLIQTPFGVERLDYKSVEIDRDIEVNTGLTTSE